MGGMDIIQLEHKHLVMSSLTGVLPIFRLTCQVNGLLANRVSRWLAVGPNI
jgi:hypothetical protein